MYKAILVDDNKVARLMLSEMLQKIEGVEIAAEFDEAPPAITYLKKEEVDLLFLDVEMPGMSGIELLKVLPERPLTILVTAQPSYAVEAFELNVVDYLVKPFPISRVMLAVEKATELLSMKNADINMVKEDNIFIKDGKTIRNIQLSSILWIESKGDYVKITTQKGNYIVHATLRSVEEKLTANEFIRIHRGYIIPTGRIEYIEDGAVYIEGTPLPVSENYRNELLRKLNML